MRISDVAKRLSIPVSTIRYYEKQSIIPVPNKVSGARSFSESDIKIISFVRDAQSVGFSLKEVAALVNNDPGLTDYATHLAALSKKHRETLRHQIAKLKKIDVVLAAMESCQCCSVNECDISALIGEYLDTPKDKKYS